MKICIFTETYYPVIGGGETQARLLADGLIAQGHSVIILTRRSDTILKRLECYGAVTVYRIAPSGAGQWKKWGLLLSGFPMLLRLRDQYDLIFVSGYRIIGLAAVLAGKLLRKPIVLKADSQGEMSGDFFKSGLTKLGFSPTSTLFRLFLKSRNAILKKANAFSAISSEIAQEWASSGISGDRIHLIPNSVDTTRFFPVDREQKSFLREKFNLPPGAIIAIYTGRLVSYKGLPLLLRVWKEIRCKHENILLLLAGTGGLDMHNCEDELRAYVTSSRMEKAVVFLGGVENVSEYLQASDIFVFPTENDAFPSSIVEAMASGLLVITTPIGAIPAIVADRETGMIIQPGSFEQLFEALDVMLSNKTWASRLGQAARQTVLEKYSARRTTEKYLALFQSVLQAGQ